MRSMFVAAALAMHFCATSFASSEPVDFRLALGSRLIEFERRLAAHPPVESDMRAIDAEFDRVSLLFFSGQSEAATKQLDVMISNLPAIPSSAKASTDESKSATSSNLAEDRDAFAVKLNSLLEREDASSKVLAPAIHLALARTEKLRDDARGDTFRLVEPLSQFRSDLKAEVAALSRGENPYANRPGMTWRAIDPSGKWKPSSATLVPYRLFAPTPLTKNEARPLVIAFHGMGGDENMFGFAYGAGRLAKLAQSRGFIAVTPLTYKFQGAASDVVLDALIADVARDYAVDRDRIYLVGHSLGAGTALTLAVKAKDRIAAVAAFSGGGFANAGLPPAMIVSGEQDTIVPFAMVKRAADLAGGDVVFVPVPGRGHTLLVGEHLEQAVDFLLSHRLPAK